MAEIVTKGAFRRFAAMSPGLAVPVQIQGVEACLLLDLDECEHRRRRACGLVSITARESLRLLANLPHAEQVRILDLSVAERRLLRSMPSGAVEVSGKWVTRLIRPAVALGLFVVADDDPERGLDLASTFAPFAPRILALTRRPSDLSTVEIEARFYGIGLSIVDRDSVQTLVEPEPLIRTAGPVTWRVREEAYAAYLKADAI